MLGRAFPLSSFLWASLFLSVPHPGSFVGMQLPIALFPTVAGADVGGVTTFCPCEQFPTTDSNGPARHWACPYAVQEVPAALLQCPVPEEIGSTVQNAANGRSPFPRCARWGSGWDEFALFHRSMPAFPLHDNAVHRTSHNGHSGYDETGDTGFWVFAVCSPNSYEVSSEPAQRFPVR